MRLMNTAEFAREVGVHQRTVRNWIECNVVRSKLINGRFWIPVSELQRVTEFSDEHPPQQIETRGSIEGLQVAGENASPESGESKNA